MSPFRSTLLTIGAALALLAADVVCGFVVVPQTRLRRHVHTSQTPPIGGSKCSLPPHQNNDHPLIILSSSSSGGYTRQGDQIEKKEREPPYPKIGDVVRYYDVDGGRQDGEVLVGKISLIQPILTKKPAAADNDNDDGTNRWLVEISQLEDVGEGYYAEYPSRKRRSKRSLRNLEYISPLAASFVRTEDAYKVPTDKSGTGRPIALFEQYKLVGYGGPAAVPVDEVVVRTDLERYADLKTKLLRDAALTGLAGALIADLARGLDDAIIYLTGAVAGVGYLFFLSVKTDTVGSTGAKIGSNVSNFRFVLPLLVVVSVAARNLVLGDASPLGPGGSSNWFSTVTTEQFACAMIGFLTYRIPLFVGQLTPVVGDSASSLLPGSAGMAFQMAKEAKAEGGTGAGAGGGAFEEDLTPVLLVCGPPGTGKTSLVNRLIADDARGRFVPPRLVDRIKDPANFERLERKEAFLRVEGGGRYGLTGEGILDAAGVVPASTEAEAGAEGDGEDENEKEPTRQVVVADADIDLAKKLTDLSGARLIGVWVGLDSMDKFESRLKAQIESGDLKIPEDEEEESVIRAKIREIVQNIEYGVISGIFEFTILNDDFDTSLAQLKEAAEYCYK